MTKRAITLITAVTTSLLAQHASAQQPDNCDATAVGVRIVAVTEGAPIEPGACVIPGQQIVYRTAPFVPPNPPFAVYCDIVEGQLGVTFPDWHAAADAGAVEPGQFVPVAGYMSLPAVPQFGNGEGTASAPIGLFTVPEVYVVDPDDADANGFLNARSDYGQTSFLNQVGLTQENGIVQFDPMLQTANATITTSTPMCLPAILLEKSADRAVVCEGVPTDVTYTYMVTNVSTPPPGEPLADLPNLTNVVLVDDMCGTINGPLNDDGDGVLNAGETWIYTCTTSISTTTTNTATVTANAQAVFPPGMTIDTVEYTDTDQFTVNGAAGPSVSVDPPSAEVCDGGSQQFCAVGAGGTGDYEYSWTGPGGFTADTQCITVGVGGDYCVTITDENGCTAMACGTLTVNENPSVSIDPPAATICDGSTQEFCAMASGGAGGYTYDWTGPGGFTAVTQCITVGTAGDYCVVVTDANSCTSSTCATLTVVDDLEVEVDPPSAAVCEGASQQFCAIATGGSGALEYAWTGPGGFTADTQCITVSEAGQYCVTVTDSAGCEGMACATLTVNENLSVSVDPPSASVCTGDSAQFCAVVGGGTGPYDYSWTGPGGFSASTECITASVDGQYCVTVTDANGCEGTGCATLSVNPIPPCTIDGPAAVDENTVANYCGPAGAGFDYAWSVSGSCMIVSPDDAQCVDVAFGDWPGNCDISLTVTTDANCQASCERTVQILCVDGCPDNPGGCTEKGSLLVYSKVEIRWDASGALVQDTFISIINDFPEDVRVQMYFINGDPETYEEPGWNWVDNLIELTKNEPTYWSALTGEPKGVSPFTVLDPGMPPGRPCPDGSGDRCLRGYILAWAVNSTGEEIKWNHLAGSATLVNYRDSYAWEYNACAFPVADPALPNGSKLGTPGLLLLDGTEYAPLYDVLIMDFYASGSMPFAAGNAPHDITVETDLTLHPADVDLRQETDGPVTTKAHFDIWNENEVKFSGTYRCITCWDQTLLRDYGIPNHFLVDHLQTDKGKARIDGLQSQLCPDSQDNALLGVVAKFLSFNADMGDGGPASGTGFAAAGTNLHGAGTQDGVIMYDTGDLPPESLDPEAVIDAMIEQISRTIPKSNR